MARHKFTAAQRKAGTLKALKSPNLPPNLKKGLQKYAKKKGWL